MRKCLFQKSGNNFVQTEQTKEIRNVQSFSHNCNVMTSRNIEDTVINGLLKNDNTIIIEPTQHNSYKIDVSLIQCFFGTDIRRINATKKAIELNFKHSQQPIQHIFIEAQTSEGLCQFKWVQNYGIRHVFKQIPAESEGIFLKPALWNIGAHMASCGKLAFLDSDIVMCKNDWLQSVYIELTNNDVISLHSKCYYAEQDFSGNDAELSYYKKLNTSIGYVLKNTLSGHGHMGFSIGMTSSFFNKYFKGFDCIPSKHEDILYWARITGIEDYDVPYKGLLHFNKMKTDLKIGCGTSICAHIAHGPISEREYQESKKNLSNIPFSEFIYDKSTNALPIWRNRLKKSSNVKYQIKSLKNKNIFNRLLRTLNKQPKVALVCIAKNDDKYIDEWIQYHQTWRFDQIFIYQNNWKCDLRVKYDNITLYEHNELGEIAQFNAYNDFIQYHHDDYDYALFIDVDEFFYSSEYNDIHDVIRSFSDVDFDGLAFNWLFFGDGNQITVNGDYNVLPRFHYCEDHLDNRIKTLVNLKKIIIQQQGEWFSRSVHGISKDLCRVYNANKTRLHAYSPRECWKNEEDLDVMYSRFYIAHYRTKSMEECKARNTTKQTWVSPITNVIVPDSQIEFDKYSRSLVIYNDEVFKRLYKTEEIKTKLYFCTVFRKNKGYYYLFLLNWLSDIQRFHKNTHTLIFANKDDIKFINKDQIFKHRFKIDFSKIEFININNEFKENNNIFEVFMHDYSNVKTNRILYMDIDLEIKRDLYSLFKTPFDEKLMLVTSNFPPFELQQTYSYYMKEVPLEYHHRFTMMYEKGTFNGGIIMLNLEKLIDIQQKVHDNLGFIKKIGISKNQHILNYLFFDEAKMISGKYNNLYSNDTNSFTFDKKTSYVNHYTASSKIQLIEKVFNEIANQ